MIVKKKCAAAEDLKKLRKILSRILIILFDILFIQRKIKFIHKMVDALGVIGHKPFH